ncbi:hypothetical protein HY641_02965 [Candidatus Woesearchaeota archaeon]|nr:hypothetical protein [Candidatus Woesearchaeota archaeon]
MATFVFGPQWFLGIDSMFEMISVVIALAIAWYSRKAHKLTDDAKYQSISAAFFLIAIGMALKIATNFSIYHSIKTLAVMGATTALSPAEQLELIYDIGYFLARYLYINGLMLLLITLVLKVRDTRIIALFSLFNLIAILLSSEPYHIFHGLAITLLLFITHYYYQNSKSRKTTTSKCVFYAFTFLLLAHTSFVLVSESWRVPYVIGEALQLFAFLLLATNLILIMRRR